MCKALLSTNWLFAIISAVFFACFPTAAIAQIQCGPGAKGNNAVWTTTEAATVAFVDAQPYGTDSRCLHGTCDICQAINLVLCDYGQNNTMNILNGIVIDARGFNPGTMQSCSVNPWNGLSQMQNPMPPQSDTVLLPSGTINIQQQWILSSETRVTGEGPNLTTLQACTTSLPGCPLNSNFSGPDMIDMGQPNLSVCPPDGSKPGCKAVVVEHLALNGSGLSVNGTGVNGIVNAASEELSRVDDVALINIAGTGLTVLGGAGNSGPYSKIYYSGGGTCANISATAGPSLPVGFMGSPAQ